VTSAPPGSLQIRDVNISLFGQTSYQFWKTSFKFIRPIGFTDLHKDIVHYKVYITLCIMHRKCMRKQAARQTRTTPEDQYNST